MAAETEKVEISSGADPVTNNSKESMAQDESAVGAENVSEFSNNGDASNGQFRSKREQKRALKRKVSNVLDAFWI